MARILAVDDDDHLRFTIAEVLRATNFEVLEANSAKAALELLDDADVVLCDLVMPGMDGLALLSHIVEQRPEVPVVMLTAHGSERIAVDAIKRGAYDYLAKPFDIDELTQTIARAVETASLRASRARFRMQQHLGKPIIGDSPAFRRVLDAARRLATRDVPVLIRGETGTGKELVAGLLHSESSRAEKSLVRINCAAIPEQLAESELFGFRKGAFTGATADHRGHFQRADGGTLIIDEIGELAPAVQPKLLRALQEGEVQPLGAAKVEQIDVRVVACTHRDLRADAAAGRFREDLYFRLAVVELEVPPLRDRLRDIAPLARHFAQHYQDRFGGEVAEIDEATLSRLHQHSWPGNVRELENCIARWVALGVEQPLEVAGSDARADPASSSSSVTNTTPSRTTRGTYRQQVASFERQLLQQALADNADNQSAAARSLGLSRVTFIDKLKRHDLFRRRQ